MANTLARWTAGLLALLGSGVAHAQTATVTLDLDQQAAQQLGLDVEQVESELGTLINDELRLDVIGDFMSSMANAAAISSRGMGVDHASNPTKFVLGGSVGTGVHNAGFTFAKGKETLPSGGFAAQVSLMAGLNLGGVLGAGDKSVARRILVYANGMAMPLPSGSPLAGSMYNVGAHLQIRAVGPVNAKVVEWGGLALNAGFERSTYTLKLRRELPIETTLQGVDVAWTATGDFDVTAVADAVPLEVSTNLRVLVLTLFGGGGVDIVTASSVAGASLGGPIQGTAKGETRELGTASVAVTADGLGDAMVPRVFVGAQANILLVKAYGQLNIGLNDALGGHVGLRVAL